MLRAREMLGMLHWGTPRASGWLAGSRRASSCAQMMMMMMLLYCLRGLILRGSLRGSVEGGRFSWLSFLGGMGAGSSIQLR